MNDARPVAVSEALPAEIAPPRARDASPGHLLPAEMPLHMPEQDFHAPAVPDTASYHGSYWVPRAAIVFGTLLLTGAFAYELYSVLSFVRMTPIQSIFLVLSTLAFGWMALGSMSCALGFLPLFAGDRPDTVKLPASPGAAPRERVALLFPVYHEEPARIAGTIEAMAEELRQLGGASAFDIFVLSDTRSAEGGAAEELAYGELKRRLARSIGVFYRRRLDNTARKAGNIEDWVERFGAGYSHFVILDADSVMSGATLMRLAHAMEEHPKAGLIQTVPRLTGGTTLLQRLQQFAGNVYGPAVAAGLAFWHRDQGNYWGHNAIIRTKAFAAAAGLPELPGKAPFGGHIQSHDFVEAVLLQRAGWGVHMVPTVDGSYEGLPPTLTDLVVRDRRWAQGNLQHLGIVGLPGLTPMGRVHLLFGAFSYIVSAVWAGSLAVGVVLALQGQQLIPSYFQDSKTLFPIWPVIDPGAALRLFCATMAVVLLPKALGLVLEIKRVMAVKERGGTARALLGTFVETIFSMLLAPILMVTQTTAVFQVLLGRDSGWKQQPRDGNEVPFDHAVRFHWRHMLLGWALLAIMWQTSPALVAWMAPVIAGLILAAPITWLTSQPAGPILTLVLATQEDRAPPPILASANRQTAEWMHRLAAMRRDRAGVSQAA